MEYKVSKGKKSTVEIAITLNKQEWEKAIENAYQKTKGKYAHQGFRKGQVPRKVLENAYGKGLFYEDAINYCFGEYYSQVLDKEKDLKVVAQPDLDIKNLSDDGITMIAVTAVMPEIELGAYKGITIKKVEYNVSDKDIEGELKTLQERNSRLVQVTDRALADGDSADIDFTGILNGKKFNGGAAKGYKLIIGSKSFIPGFEEQLIGMKTGENKNISVKFPADYGSKDLAGKDVVFEIKLNAIEKKELPEINDELVKNATEWEDIKTFKIKTKEMLTERNKSRADRETEDNLLKEIVAKSKMEIPDAMLEQQVDSEVKNQEYMMMYQGLRLENYLKDTNQTMEKFRDSLKPAATEQLKGQLVITKIIELENIKCEKPDTDKKIEENAKAQNQSAAEYEKTLDQRAKTRMENEIVINKLFEFLKQNNKIS